MAKHGRAAVPRNGGKDDRVGLERSELPILRGREFVLPEIESAVAPRDVVEAVAIRLPQRPAAFAALAFDLPATPVAAIQHPDLPGARALIALPPPDLALAGKKHALPIRRHGAFRRVIIQQHLLRLARRHIQPRQPCGVFPKMIARDADQQPCPVWKPLLDFPTLRGSCKTYTVTDVRRHRSEE